MQEIMPITIPVEIDASKALPTLSEVQDGVEQLKTSIDSLRYSSQDSIIPGFTRGVEEQLSIADDNVDYLLRARQSIDTATNDFDRNTYIKNFQTMYNRAIRSVQQIQESVQSSADLEDMLTGDVRQMFIDTLRPAAVELRQSFSAQAKAISRASGNSSKNNIIKSFMNSSEFNGIAAQYGLFDDAKGFTEESVRKYLEATYATSVSQLFDSRFVGWENPNRNTPQSIRERLPQKFRQLSLAREPARVPIDTSAEKLTKDEAKILTDYILAHPYITREAEQAGLVKRYNGNIYANPEVTRSHVGAFAGNIGMLFESGVRGGPSSGMASIENEKALTQRQRQSALRKTNLSTVNAEKTAEFLSNQFDWLTPYYAEAASGVGFTKPTAQKKSNWTNVGKMTGDPRHDAMEFYEVSLDNISNGQITIPKWDDNTPYENRPFIRVQRSLMQNMLSKQQGADPFVHNGLNRNEIYVKMPIDTLADYESSPEEIDAIRKRMVEIASAGSLKASGLGDYEFGGFTNTHMVLTRKDLKRQIENNPETANFFYNGNSPDTVFKDYESYSRAMDYNRKLRTEGESVEDLWGSDLSDFKVVVGDLKAATGNDGQSIVSDKYFPGSFQSRRFRSKGTDAVVNMANLRELYKERIAEEDIPERGIHKGDLVFPTGGINGGELVIPADTALIEDMSTIKTKGWLTPETTQAEANQRRTEEIRRYGIMAKTSAEGFNTNVNYISSQEASTLELTKEAREYFRQVGLQKLAELDNVDAVKRQLFSGNDSLSKLIQEDEGLINTPMAQDRIFEYRRAITSMMRGGNLLLPSGTGDYAMLQSWIPNIFGSLIPEDKRTPEEQKAMLTADTKLNGLGAAGKLDPDLMKTVQGTIAYFGQKESEIMELYRNPSTYGGNIVAQNAAIDEYFQQLANALNIDKKAIYANPKSAMLPLMQTADEDGDTVANFPLLSTMRRNKAFSQVMIPTLIATAERFKRIQELSGLTDEDQKRRAELQTDKLFEDDPNKTYSLANAEDQMNWFIYGQKRAPMMGLSNSIQISARQRPLTGMTARALRDAQDHYDAVSNAGVKENKKWNPTRDEWDVAGEGNPFFQIFNWAEKSIKTVRDHETGDVRHVFDHDLFNRRNIHKLNFTSVHDPHAMIADLENYMVNKLWPEQKEDRFDWADILGNYYSSKPIDENTASGKYQAAIRKLQLGKANGDFFAFSDSTVERLKALATDAYKEISDEVRTDPKFRGNTENEINKRFDDIGGNIAKHLEEYGITESRLRADHELRAEITQAMNELGFKSLTDSFAPETIVPDVLSWEQRKQAAETALEQAKAEKARAEAEAAAKRQAEAVKQTRAATAKKSNLTGKKAYKAALDSGTPLQWMQDNLGLTENAAQERLNKWENNAAYQDVRDAYQQRQNEITSAAAQQAAQNVTVTTANTVPTLPTPIPPTQPPQAAPRPNIPNPYAPKNPKAFGPKAATQSTLPAPDAAVQAANTKLAQAEAEVAKYNADYSALIADIQRVTESSDQLVRSFKSSSMKKKNKIDEKSNSEIYFAANVAKTIAEIRSIDEILNNKTADGYREQGIVEQGQINHLRENQRQLRVGLFTDFFNDSKLLGKTTVDSISDLLKKETDNPTKQSETIKEQEAQIKELLKRKEMLTNARNPETGLQPLGSMFNDHTYVNESTTLGTLREDALTDVNAAIREAADRLDGLKQLYSTENEQSFREALEELSFKIDPEKSKSSPEVRSRSRYKQIADMRNRLERHHREGLYSEDAYQRELKELDRLAELSSVDSIIGEDLLKSGLASKTPHERAQEWLKDRNSLRDAAARHGLNPDFNELSRLSDLYDQTGDENVLNQLIAANDRWNKGDTTDSRIAALYEQYLNNEQQRTVRDLLANPRERLSNAEQAKRIVSNQQAPLLKYLMSHAPTEEGYMDVYNRMADTSYWSQLEADETTRLGQDSFYGNMARAVSFNNLMDQAERHESVPTPVKWDDYVKQRASQTAAVLKPNPAPAEQEQPSQQSQLRRRRSLMRAVLLGPIGLMGVSAFGGAGGGTSIEDKIMPEENAPDATQRSKDVPAAPPEQKPVMTEREMLSRLSEKEQENLTINKNAMSGIPREQISSAFTSAIATSQAKIDQYKSWNRDLVSADNTLALGQLKYKQPSLEDEGADTRPLGTYSTKFAARLKMRTDDGRSELESDWNGVRSKYEALQQAQFASTRAQQVADMFYTPRRAEAAQKAREEADAALSAFDSADTSFREKWGDKIRRDQGIRNSVPLASDKKELHQQLGQWVEKESANQLFTAGRVSERIKKDIHEEALREGVIGEPGAKKITTDDLEAAGTKAATAKAEASAAQRQAEADTKAAKEFDVYRREDELVEPLQQEYDQAGHTVKSIEEDLRPIRQEQLRRRLHDDIQTEQAGLADLTEHAASLQAEIDAGPKAFTGSEPTLSLLEPIEIGERPKRADYQLPSFEDWFKARNEGAELVAEEDDKDIRARLSQLPEFQTILPESVTQLKPDEDTLKTANLSDDDLQTTAKTNTGFLDDNAFLLSKQYTRGSEKNRLSVEHEARLRELRLQEEDEVSGVSADKTIKKKDRPQRIADINKKYAQLRQEENDSYRDNTGRLFESNFQRGAQELLNGEERQQQKDALQQEVSRLQGVRTDAQTKVQTYEEALAPYKGEIDKKQAALNARVSEESKKVQQVKDERYRYAKEQERLDEKFKEDTEAYERAPERNEEIARENEERTERYNSQMEGYNKRKAEFEEKESQRIETAKTELAETKSKINESGGRIDRLKAEATSLDSTAQTGRAKELSQLSDEDLKKLYDSKSTDLDNAERAQGEAYNKLLQARQAANDQAVAEAKALDKKAGESSRVYASKAKIADAAQADHERLLAEYAKQNAEEQGKQEASTPADAVPAAPTPENASVEKDTPAPADESIVEPHEKLPLTRRTSGRRTRNNKQVSARIGVNEAYLDRARTEVSPQEAAAAEDTNAEAPAQKDTPAPADESITEPQKKLPLTRRISGRRFRNNRQVSARVGVNEAYLDRARAEVANQNIENQSQQDITPVGAQPADKQERTPAAEPVRPQAEPSKQDATGAGTTTTPAESKAPADSKAAEEAAKAMAKAAEHTERAAETTEKVQEETSKESKEEATQQANGAEQKQGQTNPVPTQGPVAGGVPPTGQPQPAPQGQPAAQAQPTPQTQPAAGLPGSNGPGGLNQPGPNGPNNPPTPFEWKHQWQESDAIAKDRFEEIQANARATAYDRIQKEKKTFDELNAATPEQRNEWTATERTEFERLRGRVETKEAREASMGKLANYLADNQINQETLNAELFQNRLQSTRDSNSLAIEQMQQQYNQYHRNQRAQAWARSGIGRTMNQWQTRKESLQLQQKNLTVSRDAAQRDMQAKKDYYLKSRGTANEEKARQAYQEAQAKYRGFEGRLSATNDELKASSGPISAAAAAFNGLGSAISNVASRLGRRMFMKVTQEVKQFVQQFSKSMTEIQMITLKSDSEMEKLGSGLIDKAQELKMSVSDVTKISTDLYRQGLSDEEMAERMDVIAKFSKVSGTKAGDATKLITTAMNTGLVTNASDAADIVTALGDTAATNAAQIEKGVEKAGAAAAVDGTSFGQLAALLTAVTATTQVTGNVAGTTLNSIFGRMNKVGTSDILYDENGNAMSGSDIATLLRAQGIDYLDENGKKRSTFDILRDLSGKYSSMSDLEQRQIATAVAGTRQYSNFSAIMTAFKDGEMDRYMEEIDSSGGITNKKFDIYADSLQASITSVKTAFDELINDLADNGSLTNFFDGVEGIISGVDNLAKSIGGLGAALTTAMPVMLGWALLQSGIATANPWLALGGAAAVGIGLGVAALSKPAKDPRETYKELTEESNERYNSWNDKINRAETLKNKTDRSESEDQEFIGLIKELSVFSSIGAAAGSAAAQLGDLASSIKTVGDASSNASAAIEEAKKKNEQAKLADVYLNQDEQAASIAKQITEDAKEFDQSGQAVLDQYKVDEYGNGLFVVDEKTGHVSFNSRFKDEELGSEDEAGVFAPYVDYSTGFSAKSWNEQQPLAHLVKEAAQNLLSSDPDNTSYQIIANDTDEGVASLIAQDFIPQEVWEATANSMNSLGYDENAIAANRRDNLINAYSSHLSNIITNPDDLLNISTSLADKTLALAVDDKGVARDVTGDDISTILSQAYGFDFNKEGGFTWQDLVNNLFGYTDVKRSNATTQTLVDAGLEDVGANGYYIYNGERYTPEAAAAYIKNNPKAAKEFIGYQNPMAAAVVTGNATWREANAEKIQADRFLSAIMDTSNGITDAASFYKYLEDNGLQQAFASMVSGQKSGALGRLLSGLETDKGKVTSEPTGFMDNFIAQLYGMSSFGSRYVSQSTKATAVNEAIRGLESGNIRASQAIVEDEYRSFVKEFGDQYVTDVDERGNKVKVKVNAPSMSKWMETNGISWLNDADDQYLTDVLGAELAGKIKSNAASPEERLLASRMVSNGMYGGKGLSADAAKTGREEVQAAINSGELRNYSEYAANQYMSGFSGWGAYSALVRKKEALAEQGEALSPEEQKMLDSYQQAYDNYMQDAEIQFDIQGLEDLEKAGKLLEGTASLIERIRKGGRFKIEAELEIANKSAENIQQEALLTNGTMAEQIQAISELTGMKDYQIESNFSGARQMAFDVLASKHDERAAYYTQLLEQYADQDESTLIMDMASAEGYQLDKDGNYVYVGTSAANPQRTNPYFGKQKQYSDAELYRARQDIIKGELTKDTDYDRWLAAMNSGGREWQEYQRLKAEYEAMPDNGSLNMDERHSAYSAMITQRRKAMKEERLTEQQVLDAERLEEARLNSGTLGGMYAYAQEQYRQNNKGGFAANKIFEAISGKDADSATDLLKVLGDPKLKDSWKDLLEASPDLAKKFEDLGIKIGKDGQFDLSGFNNAAGSAQAALEALASVIAGLSEDYKNRKEVKSTGEKYGLVQDYLNGLPVDREAAKAALSEITSPEAADIIDQNIAKHNQNIDEQRAQVQAEMNESMSGYIVDADGTVRKKGSIYADYEKTMEYEAYQERLAAIGKDSKPNIYDGMSEFNANFVQSQIDNAAYGSTEVTAVDKYNAMQTLYNAATGPDPNALRDIRNSDKIGLFQQMAGSAEGFDTWLQGVEILRSAGIELDNFSTTSEECKNAFEGTNVAINDFAKSNKLMASEMRATNIEALKPYGEHSEEIAGFIRSMAKGGKEASTAIAGFHQKIKTLNNGLVALKNSAGKSGKQINGKDRSALAEITGEDADTIKEMSKEDIDALRKRAQSIIDDDYVNSIGAMVTEEFNRVLGEHEITADMAVKFDVNADGAIDTSEIEAAAKQLQEDGLATLAAYAGTIGELLLKVQEGDGSAIALLELISGSTKPGGTGKRSGGGGGGGGGESDAQKMLKRHKHEVTEAEHKVKMEEIYQTHYDFVNDYDAYIDSLGKEEQAYADLEAVYQRQIGELEGMMGSLEAYSDDWWSVKEALDATKESLADVQNKIDAIETKRVDIIIQKQENEDKPTTQKQSLWEQKARGYQIRGQFESYAVSETKRIEEIDQQRKDNEAQIAELEKTLAETTEGGDAWLKARDQIWAIQVENATLANDQEEARRALQLATVQQWQTDLENRLAPRTHEQNILDTWGNLYQTNRQYDYHRNTLSQQNELNQQNIGLYTANIAKLREQMGTLIEGSEAWYAARDAIYQYEEAIAQATVSIDENNRTIQQSKIDELKKEFEDINKDLSHQDNILKTQQDRYDKNGNFTMYQSVIGERLNVAQTNLAELERQLDGYLAIQGEITEGTDQWDELTDAIRSTSEEYENQINEVEELQRLAAQSKFEHDQELFSRQNNLDEHLLKMIQYEESMYQNRGELTNQNHMIELENEQRRKMVASLQDYLVVLQEDLDMAEAGTDEYYKIADAIYKAEEQMKNHTNAIEKNTETMKKNEEQILKTHKALLDTIDNEFKARDKQRREMLSAEVSIQNQILNLIRNRYKAEWQLIKEDIARKKQALQEEKALITERLNARLNADKMQDKAEELSELKRQLTLIASDPTRTKDAIELTEKIETLEKELADQIAQDEAKAATEQIDDETKALDEYMQYNEKMLNEMLRDANSTKLAEELNAVMGDDSMSREDRIARYMEWIRQNDDNYKYGTEAMRMQLEQSNTDSWNKMLGFVETYWDQIDEIVGGGLDAILTFMKESWSWRDASEPGRELLERGWQESYEDYIAAYLDNADYAHEHQLAVSPEDEIFEINDGVWELVGLQRELYDLYNSMIEFDYIRPTDVDPDADKNDYRDYAGVGRAARAIGTDTASGYGDSGGGSGGGQSRRPTATVYYSTSSGIVRSVTATGRTRTEAQQAAYEQVPGNALWASTRRNQASNTYTPSAQKKDDDSKKKTVKGPNDEGGLINYTGLAWVDGSMERPESFLDATDTELLRGLLDTFKYVSVPSALPISEKWFGGSNTSIGDINITVNATEISTDEDIEQIARKVGRAFTRQLERNGLNLAGYTW